LGGIECALGSEEEIQSVLFHSRGLLKELISGDITLLLLLSL
jgi:hypothetical protein